METGERKVRIFKVLTHFERDRRAFTPIWSTFAAYFPADRRRQRHPMTLLPDGPAEADYQVCPDQGRI